MEKLKIACIGAGYFAPFQLEAWNRIEETELVALCDLNEHKLHSLANTYNIPNRYTDVHQMLQREELDVIDIITPPETHLDLLSLAFDHGHHVICQKPLAPDLKTAQQIVKRAYQSGQRFMVHENFRFQPWYRKIKELLDERRIGERLHRLYFHMRSGDGWGEDAYLERQPYFREMPRLLIYETGIHFIDTFRYLLGEVESVFAKLQKLNPVIAGEDAAMIIFSFQNGCQAIWDANRFNEGSAKNPRYTFGTMTIEGSKGSIMLDTDGKIMYKPLGENAIEIPYHHQDKNFAGDCVYHTQSHFVKALLNGAAFETEGSDYLKNLVIQEAIYQSHERQIEVNIPSL